MAIVLPVPLTIQEIRVLQEFRRLGSDSLGADAIRAIKHPTGGGDAPAASLVAKGYLAASEGLYTVTETARAFLAIDHKPAGEGDDGAPAAE